MATPFLLFADQKGKIHRHPYLKMLGAGLDSLFRPRKEELIKLPAGSTLFYLPGRLALGFNPATKKVELVKAFAGKRAYAVSAFPIPAYLRLYNPAATIADRKTLPLWAYTACGVYSSRIYITAARVDKRVRQSPRFYKTALVKKGVRFFLKNHPQNRLYRSLSHCALNYNCLAAKNLFLKRWEAPLPTARFCNARCIGCLSYQEGDCASSHQRIKFKPRIEEVVAVTVNHLKVAREAIISFGQGCEGEPLLEADLIAASIYKVRGATARGTINMNTNASIPKKIEQLCRAGIDSFRVSLNSPEEKAYNLYFKPRNYKFRDVLKSIEIAKRYNKFVSVNLFVFPGFSDSESQIKSLVKFVKNTGIDMIQWRNLNIDPHYYSEIVSPRKSKPQGILQLLSTIKKQFPDLKTGYFNLPKEEFSS